jgi:hypothetical protein
MRSGLGQNIEDDSTIRALLSGPTVMDTGTTLGWIAIPVCRRLFCIIFMYDIMD